MAQVAHGTEPAGGPSAGGSASGLTAPATLGHGGPASLRGAGRLRKVEEDGERWRG